MRAAGIQEVAGLVEMLELPDPRTLADDEVLIQVRAAGVANWDEIVRTGGWEVGSAPPMALGVEGAGVISAVGEGVRGWAPGDEVLTHPLPLRDQGTWAPQLIAPAAPLARKPGDVSWEEAAVLPVPALTAEQVLGEALALSAGERLLVHGAGGVTGGVLVALAALRGADTIATASPANHDRLRGLGAREVIDYHDADWPEEVRAITGGSGVDAAVNAARGQAAATIRAVRDRGKLATITSGPPDEQRGITIADVYVRPDGPQLQKLADLCAAGSLHIDVAATFNLAGAADALAHAVTGDAGGAIAISLRPGSAS
jgi:NADPH:quinone reductase-like Zn-dependent oxidoreductase